LTSLNLADFQDLLDRLGEDISTWPAPQQQAAASLLEASEPARGVLEEAKLLRQALASPQVRAPAGLTDRIMQAIRKTPDASLSGSAGPTETQPETPSPKADRPLVETKFE
jgi:hypothetical protein